MKKMNMKMMKNMKKMKIIENYFIIILIVKVLSHQISLKMKKMKKKKIIWKFKFY